MSATKFKKMERKLKSVLGVSYVKSTGVSGGGCISKGSAYETDKGLVFVKTNSREKARLMFDGESEGLKTILKTNTVKVPKPLAVFDNESGGSVFVTEFIKMSSLRKHAERLGELLAKLHLHNDGLKEKSSSIHKNADETSNELEYVNDFGFHTVTCCGYIPLDNAWKKDWVEFYVQQRLCYQLNLIENEYGDREATELWSRLQIKIPKFFEGLTITPSLLHGDLWSGNAAETNDEPVVFDPAAFYGHSEFDLSIAQCFGGFPSSFYNAYHKLLPKLPGFEKRTELYKLFHYLNHWNHFGSSYRSSTLSTMRKLLKD